MTTPSPKPTPFDPYPGIPKARPVTRGPTRPSTNALKRTTFFDKKTKELGVTPLLPKDDGGGGGGGGKNDDVKTGTNANFTGLFFSALPNLYIEEALSLRSLTGNEILQVAHRENFYTTAEVLNRNIVDLVESRQFYSPAQIIKLQIPDYSFLSQNNTDSYTLLLASSTVSINIPSSGVDQSSKIQVETFAPRHIKNDTIYPRRNI